MKGLAPGLAFASIFLILIGMFGGDLLGSWFFIESEVEDSGYLLIENETRFMLSEVEFVTNCDAPKAQEACLEYYGEIRDTEDYEYGDSEESDWEAMEDIMKQIKGLLYGGLLAACLILYFLNVGEKNRAAIACLFLCGFCILIVLVFVFTFPLAIEEDTKVFSDIDEKPSLYGNNELETPDPNDNLVMLTAWQPGVAPLLILLSGVLSGLSYYDIKMGHNTKDNTEPIVITNYDIDSAPQTVVDVFKPKEEIIACPGCSSKMSIPVLNKIQNIKCGSCGLEGEIEK